MMQRVSRYPDTTAVVLLVALWLLFFWRLFTPVAADRVHLAEGDFNGQFYAFAGYQYDRFLDGGVPLWNPYNNGGFPFIADTQAAVFYPPRLVTIFVSAALGGFSVHALQVEMALHVLAYSLMCYALVRRLTNNATKPTSALAAFISAIIVAYGGFTSSYPPLQLAILEAGVWLPLVILGVLEATQTNTLGRWWMALAGVALGLSWMAGHPQTSWFLTALATAYLFFRTFGKWRQFALGLGLLALVSFGVAAVQLLPGFEYLSYTARVGLSIDAKGNGFPYQDVVQFVYPHIVSLWSPLFVGVVGLVLAVIALIRNTPQSRFWGVVALLALLLSFGANGAVYDALYNLAPGLRFFRGQERAAYLVTNALAILAGLGVVEVVTNGITQRIRRGLWILAGICGAFFGGVLIAWFGLPDNYGNLLSPIAFSTMVVVVLPLLFTARRSWLLGALLVLELFTVNMNHPGTYDPGTPPNLNQPPPIVAALPTTDPVARVDGFRGLTDNYGSLYAVYDMRGISPLFLAQPFAIIEPEKINPLAWELFAVRYVFTDWNELPIPSDIIAQGQDRFGAVNLHALDDPRPFAHLVYNAERIPNDEATLARLRDPAFNPRTTVLLDQNVNLQLTGTGNGTTTITEFTPESFTIEVNSDTDAILTLAHPDYVGWNATLDGNPTETLRAYGALTAVAIPTGEHTVTLTYAPRSFYMGAALSLFTWGGLAILGLIVSVNRRGKRYAHR